MYLFILTIRVRPSYHKIYRSYLRQIFGVGRTMAADYQSKITFSIPQGTLPWQPVFAAGRANVGTLHGI